ncbi:MAG TPA: hypothetical protein VMD02_01255 [Candidatus Omnitrophota bacterium]|nr:hypothetical protein [Candidatus Omnitrophota bacterium]
MSFISKVRARHLVSIISVSLLLLSVQVLAKKNAPDLGDVLQGGHSGFDFSFALIGFFALSLATLSVAKGYEIFSKMKDGKEKDIKSSEIDILKEDNDRLMGMHSSAQYENESLRKDVLRLESSLRERASQEEIVKKNELGLRKELEKLLQEKNRLVAEKEDLMLKANQRSIFDMGRLSGDAACPTIELEEIVIEKEKIAEKDSAVGTKIELEEIVIESGPQEVIELEEIIVEGPAKKEGKKPEKKKKATANKASTKGSPARKKPIKGGKR